MDINVTSYGSTSSSSSVRLIHGSDEVSVNWIRTQGLSAERLLAIPGAFAFCTTTNRKTGLGYAFMNPYRGTPALLEFDVPAEWIRAVLTNPTLAERDIQDQAYLFYPPVFPEMNYVMTNFSVQKVTNLDLTFDE